MAPNRGLQEERVEEDYPSSDNDSFKSFEPDSPTTSPNKPALSIPTSKEDDKENPERDAKKESTEEAKISTTTETPSKETAFTSSPSNPSAERFPPAEESRLLADSNAHKSTANTLFSTGSHENALQTYDLALSLCPNYLDYEIAVLRANVAACNLKLSAWAAAVDAATQGLECLERLEKLPVVRAASGRKDGDAAQQQGETEVVEEVDPEMEARIENLRQSGHTLSEVRRLQTKLLLRRAKARTSLGGWSALQGADEDYRVLLSPGMESSLTATDKRSVVESARALGPRLNKAKEEEVAEMMGKLKGLGNSFLKPFGLSTENFKFEQDAKTGGYSMNFEQNPRGK